MRPDQDVCLLLGASKEWSWRAGKKNEFFFFYAWKTKMEERVLKGNLFKSLEPTEKARLIVQKEN